MKKIKLIFLVLIPAVLISGCYINKSHWIADGEVSSGSKSTVNGSIHIGKNSEVKGGCRTINGPIIVGAFSKVEDLETINGNIRVEKGAVVNGDIKLINGNLHCDNGVKIEGDAGTINGKINIEGTFVEKDLYTYNGDMKLYDKTIVSGDIIIKDRRGNSLDYHDLYVELDDSTVEGDIINEDPDTDLTVYISNGGQVKGRIENARLVKD